MNRVPVHHDTFWNSFDCLLVQFLIRTLAYSDTAIPVGSPTALHTGPLLNESSRQRHGQGLIHAQCGLTTDALHRQLHFSKPLTV